MQKISNIAGTNATAAGEFTNGSVANGTPSTNIDAGILNTFQRELVNICTQAGLTLNPADDTQVYQAIALLSQTLGFVADTGAANAYVATFTPPVLAYVDGLKVRLKIANANTATSTLNVNGLGAKAIFGVAHAALQGGELIATGYAEFEYSSTLGGFVLLFCTGAPEQIQTGTKPNHAATLAQVQSQAANFITDTGTANTYVATLVPALSAYADGIKIRLKILTANTGASTLNVNGLGAKTIYGAAHIALQSGELISNGYAEFEYNSILSGFVLLFCTGAPEQLSSGSQSQHAATLSQITSVVGSARNVAMSVATASATATLTADEIIVETALGGLKYQLSNFSKTINLATTGAGGMDTGTAPVSGYVALYAILNTTTGASALLAANAPAAKATEVYSGANMPSGYTASALVGVWPTNSSGQFVSGYQTDRRLCTPGSTIINSTQSGTSNPLSAVSCAGAVPKNAKRIILSAGIFNNTSAGTYSSINISPAAAVGSVSIGGYSAPNIGSCGEVIIDLVTAQTIWIAIYASSGTATYSVSCVGYEF